MENNYSGLQQFSNFVIFQTENGKVNIDVFLRRNPLAYPKSNIRTFRERP